MKIRQLEAFRALVLSRTVTRAAEMLHISQPAATRLIADLEEGVGFLLFERQRGRLIPTIEGLALYEEVERSLIGVERIARAAQEIKASRSGMLQVAAAPEIALSLLPRAISAFLEAYPDVKISLASHTSRTVIDMLADQRCNVGFVMLPLSNSNTYGTKLIATNMVCVLPKGHRLSEKPFIEPNDLAGERFIAHPHELYTRLRVDTLFTSFGVKVNSQLEAQTNACICKLVAAGLGVSLTDPFTALDFASPSIVVKQFLPEVHDDFQILVPSQRAPSALVRAFIEHIRLFANGVLPPEFIASA